MNIKSLVVGGMVAAVATPLLALTPDQVPADNRLYIGGATATNNVLGRLMIAPQADGGACATGTVHVYASGTDLPAGTTKERIQRAFSSTGAAGNKGYAVLCTGANGLSGPIGVFKEANGGSGNGVNPVFNGTNLNFVGIGSAAAPTSCGAAVAIPADGAVSQAFTLHPACTATFATAPKAGISDVEPVRLATGAAATGLTATGIASVVFAPAVTLGLYRAMQTTSGLANTDAPATVPSFTGPQLRSILSGKILSWTRLKNDSGASGLAPADPTVYLCRRGNSSGTEKSFEIIMLNQGCTGGQTGPATVLPPDDSNCEAGGCAWNDTTYGDNGDVVFAGTSSDDVVACLNYHQANGHYAVGILSTESSPVNFRYAGINRANPDLLSAASGNYELWTENTFNTGGASEAMTAAQSAIRTWVRDHFGLPASLSAVNEGLRWAQGDGGLLAVPNPGTINTPALPLTVDKMRSSPVNLMWRAPNGKVNNCQPPVVRGSYVMELGGEGEEVNTANSGTDYTP